MMLHRARITRIVAAILTVALSTQLAESEVENCTVMSASRADGDHGGMIHHQQHGSDALSITARSGESDDQSSRTSRCNQTSLCANAPAMPAMATRSIHFSEAEPPVTFGPDLLEARSIRPDPPPPRI